MAEHIITGAKGEGLAIRFLEEKGYEIMATNWKFLQLELDIIARKGDILIVAEVKTRKSNYFGEPETFVNRQKQRNIIKAAHHYVLQNKLDVEIRFDILSIIYSDVDYRIHHIEDAFYAL